MTAFRNLARDNRGVALVEFAFAMPVLAILFVGGYQISDAVSAHRKVTTATRTIADLTTQYSAVTDSDLDTVLNASQQVMAPYSPASARMTVSQINVDAAGNGTIAWSRGKNTPALTVGSAYVVPNGVSQPNTSVVAAQILYTYSPGIASSMIGTIPLTETIYMNPRTSSSIVKQ